MQSTGHTSTQLASFVPMHGSAMMYGIPETYPGNPLTKKPELQHEHSAAGPVALQGCAARSADIACVRRAMARARRRCRGPGAVVSRNRPRAEPAASEC